VWEFCKWGTVFGRLDFCPECFQSRRVLMVISWRIKIADDSSSRPVQFAVQSSASILPVYLRGVVLIVSHRGYCHKLGTFELNSRSRVLRWTYETIIVGPKRDEVTGEFRKLHNEEFRNFYPSLNIIRQIKSIRMRWTGHVARNERGEKRVQGFAGKALREDISQTTEV
jgi:hypothetical protein